MDIQIYLYRSEDKPQYLELMEPNQITSYDLSKLNNKGNIFFGERAEKKILLPNILHNPQVLIKEGLRIYTVHSIYKASCFNIDHYDNRDREWARDVCFSECSVCAPLTNSQRSKLTKALPKIKNITKDWNLETRIINKDTCRDLIEIGITHDLLAKLEELWDVGEDIECVTTLFNYSLNALCAIIRDEKNSHLNIYYKEGESPHTLFELTSHIQKAN